MNLVNDGDPLPSFACMVGSTSESRSLRIGLLHLAPEVGAVKRNRVLLEKATRVAADMGSAWVVSGELVVSGYRFQPLIGTD
jgi:hypothetical protein